MTDANVPVQGQDLIGQVLKGRYRIDAPLGEGGMASIYLASDLDFQPDPRQVVVKVPHAQLLTEPGFRERFLREIRSLARLPHPHVVKIHDVGEHQQMPFAVVEYLGGGNLTDRIQDGECLTPEQVNRWLPVIADTLDFIHDNMYVHRDIKPDNILFDAHGNIFVSDFGIVTVLRGSQDDTILPGGGLTEVGGVIGTPNYLPPEAIENRASPAFDQYSLGVLVYKVLTGELPFDADTAQSLLATKNLEPPIPITDRGVDLPAGAARAVMRALERNPEDRFESCTDFADAFAEGLRTPTTSPLWLVAGATAIVVAAIAGIAFFLWSDRRAGATAAPELEISRELEPTPPSLADDPDSPQPPPPPAATATMFRMGSTEREIEETLELCRKYQTECERQWYEDERLQEVAIGEIEMDAHEVNNAEFAAFVELTGYRTSAEERGFSYEGLAEQAGTSWRNPQGPGSSHSDWPDHPVVHVSWRDADEYCRIQGKRLPTEAEWEYAARGVDRRVFPWGDTWEETKANWYRTDEPELSPVGSLPEGATPDGLYDLAGNVWEWTSTSAYVGHYLKGGSWREGNPTYLRAAAHLDYGETNGDIGFRCVRDLP
jgi:serine/threonine protein kinase/formylglycine-generating enzyme required for sulfatase activity